VEIQKVRFGDRLHVSVDVPAEFMRVLVPNLLLQPLVENAIKHGVATRVAGGNIRVSGARREGALQLTIYNDGPAFAEDWQSNGGVGLANLRTRLAILYGGASGLQVKAADTGGVEVVVTVPMTEA
jgi:LytS/YehU family sensor histidine kinase